MRDDVRQALANGRSLDVEGRTIDITTKGRCSGEQRIRDRLANLTAEPNFTFHLEPGVVADLPAVATVITDPAERRRVLADFVEQFNQRNGPDGEWPTAVLEEWVEGSPLARVGFLRDRLTEALGRRQGAPLPRPWEDLQMIAHANAESLHGLTPSCSGPRDQTARLRDQS